MGHYRRSEWLAGGESAGIALWGAEARLDCRAEGEKLSHAHDIGSQASSRLFSLVGTTSKHRSFPARRGQREVNMPKFRQVRIALAATLVTIGIIPALADDVQRRNEMRIEERRVQDQAEENARQVRAEQDRQRQRLENERNVNLQRQNNI